MKSGNRLSNRITILLTLIMVVTAVIVIFFGDKDDEDTSGDQMYMPDITITVAGDDTQEKDDVLNITNEAVIVTEEAYTETAGENVTAPEDDETPDVSGEAGYIEYDPAYETAFVTDSTDAVLDTENAYKFKNKELLESHYEKHGIEMGFSSAEEYEKSASAVVNSPDALHKKEKEDNDDVYYIEETNEFVIVSEKGFIRTYFLPSAGKAYYDRQ